MATGKDGAVLRQLRTLYNVGATRELTDGQLLERFATGRGEAAEIAFAALVERHGPMVLRVCRGVLDDPNDSDDAFQATFLVLVQKARGLWVQDSLGPWLHQVAYRTASCARSAAARRRRHERSAALTVEAGPARAGDELGRVLHEEIERIPERYRVPVVLCDLEGRTHEQAARHLGWPVGTVKSRLSRGREHLRARLERRGLAPGAGLLAAALRPHGPDVALPPDLVQSTVRAVVHAVIVRTLVRGSAATLARGVIRSMLLTRWLKLAPVLFVAVAATAGSGLLAHNGGAAAEPQPQDKPQAARAGDMPVTVVKPDRLRVTVSERGSLESSYNLDVFCKVEGQTTIIFIVPEGSRVTKGQIVCELDSAALKDQLINQEITMKAAEAAYRRAKFAREIAEIALVEYKEGIYVHDRETVMGQLGVTKSKLQKAKDRLDRTRRARRRLDEMLAAKREPATSTAIVAELDIDDRIDDAEQAVMRETLALEEAQTKLNVLEKFTKDKTIKELQSDVEQKRADELARQATWELEMAKQKKLITQIQNCVIKAPGDGMVVYANDPNRFGGQPRAQIEEGATVRERQKIFSVPDLKRFQVNAKVHESIVDRVTPGQTARIEVDAFPGVTLTGKVRDVAPLPDPSTFFNADVKVYSSKVTIDNPLPGLRPGMTARVVILVAEREDVISVPISAILHYDDKDHVAVKKPDGEFDWREVTLGISDDKVVEVKQGLRSGEAVALSPVALMSEEEKREKLGKPTPPAGRTPATGAAGQAKAKGKAQRPGLPPSLRAKLQNMAPEERRALFTASPEERKTALRKAGFNDDEIKQFEQLRQGSGGGRGPAAPDGRRP